MARRQGFTLIELSIVLVIIGLMAGGVLVGRDLISAAEVRATISQIEKYATATNTFREKYGALPGDIPATSVAKFGFTAVPSRAGLVGQGDGNGILESVCCGNNLHDSLTAGETAWFWEDLSANSHLIEGTFSTAGDPNTSTGPTNLALLLPPAKISGLYICVYSMNSVNYFNLSNITSVDNNGALFGNPGLQVKQAYAIDKKIDDGLPQSGSVTALYQNWTLGGGAIGTPVWSQGGGVIGAAPGTSAPASSSSCYDNGSNASATAAYSLGVSNGSNVNCGLSFQFK